jgi:hypothetical protein
MRREVRDSASPSHGKRSQAGKDEGDPRYSAAFATLGLLGCVVQFAGGRA